MIKYNDIATKQDKDFLSNCRRKLGVNKFNSLVPKVRTAFRTAYNNEPNVNKKNNVARRAANMIYTQAMMDKI